MPTHAEIDGVSREHTNWPLAVDGVSREAVSMLADVDGTQREIFSGMHMWAKYTVKTKTTYNVQDMGAWLFAHVWFHYFYCVYRSYSVSGNSFTLYNGVVLEADSGADDPTGCYATSDVDDAQNEANVDSSPKSGLSEIFQITEIRRDSEEREYDLHGRKLILSPIVSNVRGDYLGAIKSKNESAYPENGEQDGYWYVKIK